MDIFIPHQRYQVKLRSYPLFLAAYAAAIVHTNHVFGVY